MSIENRSQTGSAVVDLRPMCMDDLPPIMALQASVYPAELFESAQVLASKLSAVPPGWHSLVATDGDTLCGYVFAYPWNSQSQPQLNHLLVAQQSCDVLYVHDVAVSGAYAGRGIAHQLLTQMLRQAQQFGLARAMLVAVEGAQGYWSRQGFTAIHEVAADPAFGGQAVLMQRDLLPSGATALTAT